MNKIKSLCPLCGENKVDLNETQMCDGYMGEGYTYIIKCYGCGITMKESNKDHLINKWNNLCNRHALCFDTKTALSLYENFTNDLILSISKLFK